MFNRISKQVTMKLTNLCIAVCLSIMQAWLTFNFPLFMRWGIFACALISLTMSIFYLSIAIFPQKFAPLFDMSCIQIYPFPNMAKKICAVVITVIVALYTLYIWRINLFGTSTIYYVVCYIYTVLGMLWLIHATHKAQVSHEA